MVSGPAPSSAVQPSRAQCSILFSAAGRQRVSRRVSPTLSVERRACFATTTKGRLTTRLSLLRFYIRKPAMADGAEEKDLPDLPDEQHAEGCGSYRCPIPPSRSSPSTSSHPSTFLRRSAPAHPADLQRQQVVQHRPSDPHSRRLLLLGHRSRRSSEAADPRQQAHQPLRRLPTLRAAERGRHPSAGAAVQPGGAGAVERGGGAVRTAAAVRNLARASYRAMRAADCPLTYCRTSTGWCTSDRADTARPHFNVSTATGIVLYAFQMWAQYPEQGREEDKQGEAGLAKYRVDDEKAVGSGGWKIPRQDTERPPGQQQHRIDDGATEAEVGADAELESDQPVGAETQSSESGATAGEQEAAMHGG